MIRIVEANFLTSAPNLRACPDFSTSEIAFLGRSNVGKSSLINALTGRLNLAKSSSTPGKTRLINFFDIKFDADGEKKSALFVDLPGFGYAKVSKTLQAEWKKSLNEFIKNRPYIRTFVHLIDARHVNLGIDADVREYLRSFLRPDQKIINLYTKSDKIGQSQRFEIAKFDPGAILVSSTKKTGIDDAVAAIYGSLFQ